MSNEMKNPMQPLYADSHNTIRFKSNRIVEKLLEIGGANGYSLNEMVYDDFTQDDRVQFAQLIGYSLSGFHELSYVPDEVAIQASRIATGKLGYEVTGCRDDGCPIHCGVEPDE